MPRLKDLYLYNIDEMESKVERIFRIKDITYEQCVEITKTWWDKRRWNEVVMLDANDDFRHIFEPHENARIIDITFEEWKERANA